MKALHVGVLYWLARLDVTQFDLPLHGPGQEVATGSVPGRCRSGLCVVRAKPIAHPEPHQEHDEKVGHTYIIQGLHVLTC
jgi:hypothetical protein